MRSIMEGTTMSVTDSWGVMTTQLAEQRPSVDRPRFNPRPPGSIQPGSATEVVLIQLRRNPDRWCSKLSIVWHTGRTGKSVDWALLFLRKLGLIEAQPDGIRAHALRYRITVEGMREGGIGTTARVQREVAHAPAVATNAPGTTAP